MHSNRLMHVCILDARLWRGQGKYRMHIDACNACISRRMECFSPKRHLHRCVSRVRILSEPASGARVVLEGRDVDRVNLCNGFHFQLRSLSSQSSSRGLSAWFGFRMTYWFIFNALACTSATNDYETK